MIKLTRNFFINSSSNRLALCGVLFFLIVIQSLIPDIADAAGTQDANILSQITLTFQTKAKVWGKALQVYAFSLFRILLIADVCLMGIRMALKQAEIQEVFVEFIRLTLFAGLMVAVIHYHKTWANAIIMGLGKIAQIELGAPAMEAGEIFWAGLGVVKKIWDKISLFSPAESTGMIIFAIAIVIVFALITAQVVLIKCEAYIVLNAGTILLGFGGSKLTKDYAINFLRYSLAIAVKLFVMQLLVSLAIAFTNDLGLAEVTLEDLAIVLGASIVLLALTMTIPDICSGIINGSHVSTGLAITSAVTAVSTATIAAMQGLKESATGGKSAVDAIKEANKFANDAGMGGIGKAGHMAKSLASATKASKSPTFGQNVSSNLKAMRESFNMDQEADQSDKD